jgi:hypothetical protein
VTNVIILRMGALLGSALMALMLGACGGGGSGGDISPDEQPVSTATGSDKFLLFPNPQRLPDRSLQTDSQAYAQAYYAAIDPNNEKDTLAKWKAANGFDTGTGTQITAVFGDQRDLGYGRRMTARKSPDGTIAFLVENYLANPGRVYGFSPLNLEAAIVEDKRWLLLVNAIEFSPGPGGSVKFAKFFNFNPTTGARQLSADIDGRGEKAMPNICVSCHGGRADALTPPDASGRQQLSVVQNSFAQQKGDVQRGDVQAHLAVLEVDTFAFSTRTGFARTDQEAALKAMNELVLCTYPVARGKVRHSPEDDCRRDAIDSEWPGTAAELIKRAYGGDGLTGPAFVEPAVPAEWSGQEPLYQKVVVPSCRGCHILRGTAAESDIDFTTFPKFQSYAVFPGGGYPKAQRFDDRIKAHVIDRGNMPLAKIVYDTFWASDNPPILAAFLEASGFSVHRGGTLLQPGRPVADPGPDRVIGISDGPTQLSAENSVLADSYSWSIVSGPDGATPPVGAVLANANSVDPTLTVTKAGAYVLQLIASQGSIKSEPALLRLFVQDALPIRSPDIRFADVKKVLQVPNTCLTCHVASVQGISRPPVLFADASNHDLDRNGDGVVDAADDAAFYAEVRSRINFTDLGASALLRKPAGHHHAGNRQPGFDDTAQPGTPLRASYDLLLNWMLNGAPR